MLTYYIGNIREKRFLFRKERQRAALADNCDVLADFKLNGKICFVLGDIPYGNMSVGEYLGYARALKTRLPLNNGAAKNLLKKAGVKVSLKRKMRSLPRYIFRAVLLAAAIDENTREVWLNFDGVPYSRSSRNGIRNILDKTLRTFGSVHAAVSDYRFIPKNANVLVASNGVLTEGITKSASHAYGKLRFNRMRRKSDLVLSSLNGKETLLCDN